MLDQLAHRLARYRPRELTLDYPEAGILVPVTDNPVEPEIIFTQRAAHLKTHRGQVAFPGGKRDREDATLLDTALRESWEEIGLMREDVRVLGMLSQVVSRYGIIVTPFVGLVPEGMSFTPNLDELDSVFSVPISFFLEDRRLRTDTLSFLDYTLYVPCYEWQGYHIWGMSAIVLVDLLNAAFDAGIDMLEPPG
ncbi:NUDIX hydrolase [Mangrovitalea sediminis]|uniref:NUDIX hydrolase n=1 Tax=Mangrovitalea sediminis TaxID=1982043 RepID=UPI000BE5510A|nr:CoA pyrophosphatase [Mangrovitalea sediminis]